eukprot:3037196-Amphidinium_carterae.1
MDDGSSKATVGIDTTRATVAEVQTCGVPSCKTPDDCADQARKTPNQWQTHAETVIDDQPHDCAELLDPVVVVVVVASLCGLELAAKYELVKNKNWQMKASLDEAEQTGIKGPFFNELRGIVKQMELMLYEVRADVLSHPK